MSTAGSVRSGDAGSAYTPPPPGPPDVPAPAARRVAIFRWRGIFALMFGFAVVALVWLIFGKHWIRTTLQDTSSQAMGTQVDIGGLSLDVSNASLELRAIAVADPFDHTRNLIEAHVARVVLDPNALLEKKVVIRELTLDSVRAGTHRSVPARAMSGGFAPRAMQALQQWRQQFHVPLLSLTPVDTIKSLILDPTQLSTVKRATALLARGDSLKTVLTAAIQGIRVRETADSAQALLIRLKGQTPRALGIVGTRNAVNDVRRFTAQIDSIHQRLDALQTTVRAGADSLAAAAKAVDDARRSDYDFARGLLKLPTIDAPNIGPALFGNVSIDAFQQAMYWMSLAREYAPPGLVPREKPGPKRARRAGTTVHFVKQTAYPQFLLQKANVTISLGEQSGAARGDYRLTASDVTTEPAIVGRPMRFSFDRASKGSAVESFAANGTVDHSGKTPRELVEVRADGVQLPTFPLPATPLRAVLGRGHSVMRLDMTGDGIAGALTISAPSATWSLDAANTRSLNTMEQLVSRVIQSIHSVDLTADIGGTMRAPRLAVRSNLDRAVADGVKSVVGTEVAKAESKIRAQVDTAAERALAPVRARVAEVRADIDQRTKDGFARLDDAKRQLAAQLKSLSGGLLGLP